ncbi:pyridoxamine 5'-phosphate oxidase family protein [Actinomadura sp. NTSP31]|uniref:pyridoxamine 5'-phosphate oxidase family protein n=1 Tax=Actinomadura sp. NTSP31 TaxID=1735447 RepID=UPI0035C0DFF4
MSTELQALDADTCLALLQSVPVGRVAWCAEDGTASILPVNFVMDGTALVFRTAPGSKFEAIRAGRPLTFEADDLEPALRTAWSVLLTGTAQTVTDPPEVDRLRSLPLAPWLDSPEPFFVRLTPEKITGRRIPLHPGGVSIEHIDPTDE